MSVNSVRTTPEVGAAAASGGASGLAVPVRWRPVAGVAGVLAVVLLAFSDRYGYTADELYFRLLGKQGPAWGYVDQPPLLPMLARVSTAVFGDSMTGLRMLAVLCAVLTLVLGVLLTAEFGGRLWAQMLVAGGLGSSLLILGIGHFLHTTSVDNIAWGVVLLCTVRALLRAEPRWWIPAGVAFGLALYAKLIIGLLLVTVVAGLLLVGPRRVLRQREFLLGGLAALVIGLPNVIYQLTHDLPQLQMARALGELDGASNRALFLTNMIFLIGPVMLVFAVAGLLGLFRERAWRPVRALGVAFLIATVAAFLIDGGRSDYVAGYLVLLLAVGAVRGERWALRRRWRTPVTVAAATLLGLPVAVLALPVIPLDQLAKYPVNSMALETVGWPDLAARTAEVARALPPGERARAVVLAQNFGQAGALDRYGAADLPPVYSGHNELHTWGPPPADADVVIALGIDESRLRADFATCRPAGTLGNDYGIENPEYGRRITVCQGPRAPWTQLWPAYRHLGAYL